MKWNWPKKRKKRFQRILVTALVLVILVQAAVLVNNYLIYTLSQSKTLPETIPPFGSAKPLEGLVSLEGFEQAEVNVSPMVIYLTSGCLQLAMITTEFQTYSIQQGIEKKTSIRPTTHDLFRDLAENFGISVKLAKIESLEDSIYYARLYIQQGSKTLGLDSKPSDAIAVAVRFNAPVYLNSKILKENAVDIC